MKLDQSVEIRPKSPGVSLETHPDIKVARNTKWLATFMTLTFPGTTSVLADLHILSHFCE